MERGRVVEAIGHADGFEQSAEQTLELVIGLGVVARLVGLHTQGAALGARSHRLAPLRILSQGLHQSLCAVQGLAIDDDQTHILGARLND